MKRKQCPCCNCKTLSKRGDYNICPVCFWEDDGTSNPDDYSGPNHMTLQEARNNYQQYGACDENALRHVRKPHKHEI